MAKRIFLAELIAPWYESNIPTGTSPLIVSSTTKVVNLNADLLDDQHGAYYLDWNNFNNKPTTVAGYGITDAITTTGFSTSSRNLIANSTYNPSITGYQYTKGITLIQNYNNRINFSRGSVTSFPINTPANYSISFWYKIDTWTSGTVINVQINDASVGTLPVTGNIGWTFWSGTSYINSLLGVYGFVDFEAPSFVANITISDLIITRSSQIAQQYTPAPEDYVTYEGNGNVGIGVSGSSYKFDVLGTTRFQGDITGTGLITVTKSVSKFSFNEGSGNSTPTIYVMNTNTGGKAAALVAGTGGSVFAFDNAGIFAIIGEPKSNFSNNTVGAGAPLLKILSNGNTIIGNTADAGYKLDVNGTGRFGGALIGTSLTASLDVISRSGNVSIGAGKYDPTLFGLWGQPDGGSDLYIAPRNLGNGSQIKVGQRDGTIKGIEFYAMDSVNGVGDINFLGGYTSALFIKGGTRNVLIGTTTDSGYKLDVVGTGRFSGNVLIQSYLTTSGDISINAGNGIGFKLNDGFSITRETGGTRFSYGSVERLLLNGGGITVSGGGTFSSTISAVGASFSSGVSVTGANNILFGPNANSVYLSIGGTTSYSSTKASIAVTNGNLHLDAASGYGLYLNYHSGNGGTIFGNGVSGSSGASVSTGGVYTATGGNSTNWNTAYGWGNHAGQYVKGRSAYYGAGNIVGDDGTDGWYTLFVVGDSTNSPITCNIRAYAHTSTSFVVTKAYSSTGSITVLNHVNSVNGSYKYLKGLRLLLDGSVQIKLNGGSLVIIEAQIFGSSGSVSLYTNLTKDTGTPSVIHTIDPIQGNGITSQYVYAGRLISDIVTGTSPFVVNSTTVVTNLNSDLLDGLHGSHYLDYNNFTNKPSLNYLPLVGGTLTGLLTLSSSIATTDFGTGNQLRLQTSATGQYGNDNSLAFVANATNIAGIRGIYDNYDTAIAGGRLEFFTRVSNSSIIEAGRITNKGNWLLGTTTDGTYKLDVNGTGRFTGAITVGAITGNDSQNIYVKAITYAQVVTETASNFWSAGTRAGGGYTFTNGANNGSVFALGIDAVGGAFTIGNGASSSFAYNLAGNVGVGYHLYEIPAKFAVRGNSHFEGDVNIGVTKMQTQTELALTASFTDLVSITGKRAAWFDYFLYTGTYAAPTSCRTGTVMVAVNNLDVASFSDQSVDNGTSTSVDFQCVYTAGVLKLQAKDTGATFKVVIFTRTI